MSKTSKIRRLMTLCLSMLLVIAGAVFKAPTASADEFTATVFSAPGWDYANVRVGPGHSFPVAKTLSAGSSVKLGCWVENEEAQGPYGKSKIWYKVDDTDNFVSDAMVSTGTDDPVTANCSEPVQSSPPPPPDVVGIATAVVPTSPGVEYVNVRSGPGTNYAIIRTYSAGSSLGINCWKTGTSLEGQNGTSDKWHRVASEPNGWISDAYINIGVSQPSTPACIDTKTPSYDREVATTWARQHANDEPRFKGNDCAFFVSRALWAGGFPQVDNWKEDNEGIGPWAKPPRNARLADALKNYLVGETGYATIKELTWEQNDVPDAQLGDLIMYDWTPADGIIDHVVIITGFSGKYPLVSGHTNKADNQGWTTKSEGGWIEDPLPGSRAYLIHITS